MILISEEKQYFSPHEFIENLLDEIGFKEAEEKERHEMYTILANHVTLLIENVLNTYIEPSQLEQAKAEFLKDSIDFWDFAEKTIEISPNVQITLAQELDHFYTSTIETYQAFNQAQNG